MELVLSVLTSAPFHQSHYNNLNKGNVNKQGYVRLCKTQLHDMRPTSKHGNIYFLIHAGFWPLEFQTTARKQTQHEGSEKSMVKIISLHTCLRGRGKRELDGFIGFEEPQRKTRGKDMGNFICSLLVNV